MQNYNVIIPNDSFRNLLIVSKALLLYITAVLHFFITANSSVCACKRRKSLI